jgi:hypothetical protein
MMEEFSMEELVGTMQEIEAAIMAGEDFMSLFYCFSKRDKYGPKKVIESRFRSIQCGDVFLLWLCQRWFSALVEFLEDKVPQFFVITSEDQYQQKVSDRLRDGFSFGVDFKAYDKSETGDIMDRSLRLLASMTKTPPVLVDFFVRTCCAPVLLLPGGDIVSPSGSNPSGQYLTSIMNSLNHLVYNACAYRDLLGIPFDAYLGDASVARSVMTGDDGIETLSNRDSAVSVMSQLPAYLLHTFGVVAKIDAVQDGGEMLPYPKGILPPYLSMVEVAVPGARILVPARFNRLLPTLQFVTSHDQRHPSLTQLTKERIVGIYTVACGFEACRYLRSGYPVPQAYLDFCQYAKEMDVELPNRHASFDGALMLDDEKFEQHSFSVVLEKDTLSVSKKMPKKARSRKVRAPSKSSSVRSGRSQTPVSVRRASVSQHMPAGPMPRVHQRIMSTLTNEGVDYDKANPETLKIHQMIISLADKFHVSVIQSVLFPAQPFPLPGINLYGISNRTSLGDQNASQPSGLIGDPNWGGVYKPNEVRGTTIHDVSNEGTVAVGRYARFSGKCLATVDLVTNAQGVSEVWFFADPTATDIPVYVLQVSTPVTGNYTDMTVAQELTWQADPYPFAKLWVAEGGDTPCTSMDMNSLYYMGGAALMVTTLNANAFLSTAYQVRTGDNIPDRFLDALPDLWSTVEPSQPFGFSDSPVTCQGAISLYTGASWHIGVRDSSGVVPPVVVDDTKFHISGALRRCWALGAPFIRCVVRTQSNGLPAAGPCQFNVRYNCWAATAPKTIALAAAQPFETVPMESPPWLKAVKTRGTTFNEDRVSAYGDLLRSVVQRIPEGMAGASPLERAIIQNPVKAVKAVSTIHVPERTPSENWLERAIGFAQRAANTVEKVVQAATPLGALVAKLLV